MIVILLIIVIIMLKERRLRIHHRDKTTGFPVHLAQVS